MINTLNTKQGIFNGLFQCGNPDSKEVVFMMGSCRGVPHLNFLNAAHGGRCKQRRRGATRFSPSGANRRVCAPAGNGGGGRHPRKYLSALAIRTRCVSERDRPIG